jgi:hypothetical protein
VYIPAGTTVSATIETLINGVWYAISAALTTGLVTNFAVSLAIVRLNVGSISGGPIKLAAQLWDSGGS